MAGSGVAEVVQKRSWAYWRELVFSRLLPALFFSVFLARQLLFTWDGFRSVHKTSDYFFVLQQVLALAYFTMLVVLYSTRLPKRGTDHRAAVIFIAFTGTFSALAAPFLLHRARGSTPRDGRPLQAQPPSRVPGRDRRRARGESRDRRVAGRAGHHLLHWLRVAPHPLG